MQINNKYLLCKVNYFKCIYLTLYEYLNKQNYKLL